MPDSVVFIRPDVQLGGAVPAAVSHPAVHNFTNAVLATASATDLGTADIRVGQGLNANVTIGTETTVAGAGNSVTVRAGDAVGGGPSAGGNITLQPGVGVGGGAAGAVLPYADNVVSLGSLTVAFTQILVNTVGSLNQDLNLVATRTTAGVGRHIIISGGPAIGGGPSAGGNVQLVPGNGVGGGARGVINLHDAGAALSVLPTTTNLVTLGSTALAFAATYTRIVQADTGQNLVINRGDGTTWVTVDDASNTAIITTETRFNDAQFLSFGTSADANVHWSTNNANNAWLFTTNVNSAAQSGNLIVTTFANRNNEHGLAAVATPRLAIFSAADMSVAGNRTQYVQVYHDGTSGYFVTGTGTMLLRPGGATRLTLSSSAAGATTATFDQQVNTSGTPTGLLFTGGAHTGLANASLNDWNIDLSRLVTFAGGGATSFALYAGVNVDAPTLGAVTAGLTVTDSATVRIVGPPVIEDGDITLTRTHSLLVAAGQVTVVASFVVGSNAAVTGGFVADIVGAYRFTAAPRADYALATADVNVPVLINTPAGVAAIQKGWRRINGVAGAEEYMPVWGV